MSAPLRPLRDLIRDHGLWTRKSLGQHFILDLNVTRRIVRSVPDRAGAWAYEVGPGPGGLTRALLEAEFAGVVAVERDERYIAALGELKAVYPDRLRVISGDAMGVDEKDLLPSPAHLVANLPYNVGTPLLFKWLERPTTFQTMTLMFQKEVAERLRAQPRTKAYGRLAVMAQWLCEVDTLFDIPRSVFLPPPRVTSTVVRLVPRATPLADASPIVLARVVAAAFGQRRKMLRASLKSIEARTDAWLAAAGIDGRRRAEELSIAEFCTLAREFENLGAQRP